MSNIFTDFADNVSGGLQQLYDKFWGNPAKNQQNALATAQAQSFAEAEKNRQFQMQGLNQALGFYRPAQNVLSEMMGGTQAGGGPAIPTSSGPPPQDRAAQFYGLGTK